MLNLSLSEIRTKVEELAKKIDAPQKYFPSFGTMEVEGHPYITLDQSGYAHYEVKERGQECEHLRFVNIDDLLYKIFFDITLIMANQYELNHRKDDQDSTMIMFSHQENLLENLSNDWGDRIKKHHESILRTGPFEDFTMERIEFMQKLRSEGVNHDEALRRALEKYPES
jgi:hypothetical protein